MSIHIMYALYVVVLFSGNHAYLSTCVVFKSQISYTISNTDKYTSKKLWQLIEHMKTFTIYIV